MDALTSASSSTPPWKYDVFLSFRGEDTRKNFTDHLYTALEHKSIHTFRDDEKLERGKDISPTLLKAIEESQFAIVVFSRNYANSSWCLDEVTKISKCKKELGQTILPIFYDVEPTHVRKQEGSFGEAFSKHRKNFKDNMERVDNWAKALAEIASISGWDVKHRHESNVIREIVENILRTLDLTFPSSEDKDLVGMVSRVRQTRLYLDKELGKVHTIGIWGPGGIGKTTTAKEVFKNNRGKFEACAFVNVREQLEKLGLVDIKMQLHEMLLDEKIKLQDIDNNALKRRLSSKKVLIVLDDVNELRQIEALVGKSDQQPNWFGQGSRIIVTTRNKHSLTSYGKDNIYEIEKLTDDEALRLFCRRAFKDNDPEDEYRELSENVVKYAKGLPLSLELLGCLLNGRDIDEWEDAVKRLEDNPTNETCQTLRLSYEGLERKEKQIFLDIACFFKGEDEQRVKKILESCGFHPTIGLSILVEKSLITIKEGKIWMHDLVQEMGWEVVRERLEELPGERSRIWLPKESMEVLEENTGTKTVQGLFLNWPGEEKVVTLNADPFSEMKNIRLLKICNVYLSGCPEFSLSKKLRLLEWHGYPLETLPSSFKPDKLVELSMPNSRIEQLWKETHEVYEKLILMNLTNCKYLTETPDFSKVPNLESLILEGCERLREVHPSIGVLHHLITLNLKDCKRLQKLPKIVNLKALKTFILSGCSNLSEFPEIVGDMNNLSELDLHGTALRELPVSISHLTGVSKFENGFRVIESNNTFCSIADSTIRTPFPMPEEHIDELLPKFFEERTNDNDKEFCQDGEVKLCPRFLQLLNEAMGGNVKTILGEQPHHEPELIYTTEDTSEPTSQRKSDLESLLSRLFQGCIARTCILFFLIPVKLIPPWFFHHSLGDTICCQLPPNLHHDKSWSGIELYVIFEMHQSGCQLEDTTILGVELYIHERSNTVPVLRYDIIIQGSSSGSQLVLYHMPRVSFPELLNQSTGISVLFRPTTRDVEVECCGTRLLYEKKSKSLVKQISNMTLGRPDILSSLHQQAQSLLLQMEDFLGNADIRERNRVEQCPNPDLGCLSAIQREKELIESLHKLLTKDVSASTLQSHGYDTLRDEHGSDEEYYTRSGVLSHSTLSPFHQSGENSIPEALTSHYLYHLHVMVDNLVLNGNDFEKWKQNLEISLEESFRKRGQVTLSLKGHILSVLNYFNPRSPFNFNFPSKEIPKWFDHQNDLSTSTIKLPSKLHEDKNWMGLVICGSFFIHEHPSSFSETSFKILCHLMTNGSCVNVVPVHFITKDKFSWLHVRGFMWITYIPHALLMDLKEGSYVSARIHNRTPGLGVKKCGIRLLYEQDFPEFKKAITQCWTSFFDDLGPIFQFVADEDGKLLHDDSRPVETRGISDKFLGPINPPKTNQDFDGESVYNACFPTTEALEWFADISCDYLATINLPQDLYSDVNWIGLALCAYFSNLDDQQPAASTSSSDNLDSELFSQSLFCYFETERGNSESTHQYKYRRSDRNLNGLDDKGFIWVSFLPRRWFLETIPPSCQLDEYRIKEASFGSDVAGLVARKCGFRQVYKHDEEEFKQVLYKLMDCQQSDQESKAEDEKKVIISPFFNETRYIHEVKEGPVVKGPTTEVPKMVEISPASPCNGKETTLEDTKIDPSIAEFDDIVTDVQNGLDNKRTTEPEINENDLLPTLEAINRVKKIFKQFMKMKLVDLIHPGRKSELKDSLSILLSTKNIFPNDMVDEMTKFVEKLDQNCHPYESAKEVIEEAKGKESVVVQLQNKLKQFTSDLRPMKTKVEAIDGEIADLDKQLIEKKAVREKLRRSFEELKGRGISTKDALVEAKRDVELVAKKKKEAEYVVKQFEDGWETLVASCSPYI